MLGIGTMCIVQKALVVTYKEKGHSDNDVEEI